MSKEKEKVDLKVDRKHLVIGVSGGMFGGTYPEFFKDVGPAEEFARKQAYISGEESLVYTATHSAEADITKSTSIKKL